MNKSNWVIVLREIYSSTEPITHPLKEIPYDNRLLTNTGLREEEVKDALIFLSSHGLIEYDDAVWSEDLEDSEKYDTPLKSKIELTEKGFNVAHDRELSKQQLETNSSVAFLTWALVLVGIIEAIRNIGSPLGIETSFFALLALMGLTIVATWQAIGRQFNLRELFRNSRKLLYRFKIKRSGSSTSPECKISSETSNEASDKQEQSDHGSRENSEQTT